MGVVYREQEVVSTQQSGACIPYCEGGIHVLTMLINFYTLFAEGA
jgi:hypothetical protein